MLKSYKYIILVLVMVACNFHIAAQTETVYKDVILDGKPAKLNVATGEITLVDLKSKKDINEVNTKSEDYVEKSSDSSKSDFHIVKEGESLFDLARQYKVSMTQLKRANNLETTLISEGQKLRVKNFNTILTSDNITEEIKDVDASKEEIINYHTVKKDDTLFSIAQRYQLSVEELKLLNALDTNLIKIGQTLKVTNVNIENTQNEVSFWIVADGDTLYSIAKKTGTSVEAIKTLNGLTSNVLSIGQKLKLK